MIKVFFYFRVFHYNAAKNESKVLVDGLWFPNGLVVSPNNDFLVIAETCRFKILKHYISGPKKGQTETFVDGLPGKYDLLYTNSGLATKFIRIKSN